LSDEVKPGGVDPDVDRGASTQRWTSRLGDFQLEDKIGQGGMGEVYRGRQVSLDRPVAIKLLPPSFAKKAQFLERFKREARAAANLLHPNVLQVYAYGVEEGKAYIAMEFIEGEDLSDVLKKGSLPLDRAVQIMKESALALAAAGDKGIVHRDIKPSNIMLDAQGNVKVMDFGLAKASEGDSGLTEAGLVVGTPKYISPEQGKGDKLDSRSDIYSLGVTFFEVLAGQPPFSAENSTSLIYKHVFESPPSLRSLNPDVPPFIEDVVLRMLAKKPDERYANGHELVRDLEEFQRHKDDYVASGRRRVAAAAPEVEEEAPAPIALAPARANPATTAMAAAGLVVGIVAVGLALRAQAAAGPPRVVATTEEPLAPPVAFTWNIDVDPGAVVYWNGEGSSSLVEPGVEYEVRPGKVTFVVQKPGYETKIVTADVQAGGAVLPDGEALGSADLRLQPSDALVEAYKEGREALEAKDYDMAVRQLERAAARDPDYKPADDQPSAKELLEEALRLQERELSFRRRHRRSVNQARELYASSRHREALQALSSVPASFDRAAVRELRGDCVASMERASEELLAVRSLVREGQIGQVEDRMQVVRRLDPGHEELDQVAGLMASAKRARTKAAERQSDPRLSLEAVDSYVNSYGTTDPAMLERQRELQEEVRDQSRREGMLREARARMRTAAAQQAWAEVATLARQVLTDLSPRDREARDQLARATRELDVAAIRAAVAQLDQACVQLDHAGGALQGFEGVALLLAPDQVEAVRQDLAGFLAHGRIVLSERRNLVVDLADSGQAAEVRWEWWVEVELRSLSKLLKLTVPGEGTLAKAPDGDGEDAWVFTRFASRAKGQ
jgi:predicted Ser/Thr protein kinase